MDSLIAQLPQQLVNGLSLGAVYALVAPGYSIVYGVLRLLNFAHGDIFMVGAFLGWGALEFLAPALDAGLPGWLAIGAMLLVSMVGCGLLGVAIEAENVRYALAIQLYPADVTLWATLGVGLKNSKIAFGIVSNLVILVLALVAAARWAQSRRTVRGGASVPVEKR